MKVAKLYPVIDGVNMKIQLAPAIVYQKVSLINQEDISMPLLQLTEIE